MRVLVSCVTVQPRHYHLPLITLAISIVLLCSGALYRILQNSAAEVLTRRSSAQAQIITKTSTRNIDYHEFFTRILDAQQH